MKIFLYCSPEAIEPLSRVIKVEDHIVVASRTTSEDLIYSIAQHTPHALVSDVGHLVARPQALSLVLHSFPNLPTYSSYLQKEGWEDKLREFLSRPRSPERPRPYATSDRTVYHDGELQRLATGKLRRPNLTIPNWRSECIREEARFILQLQAGCANHAAAQQYYECLLAQQRGLDLELGYRLVHGSYKALSWSRDLAGRWLGLLSHFVPGAELDYLPAAMTPGPAVDFVHRDPPVEALYAMTLVIHFGVVVPVAAEIQSMVGAKFDKQPDTELFQLSLRLYGFAQFLQRVAEAQISLMTAWLDPNWIENPSDRTYRRHLATYRDFWRLPFVIHSPEPLRGVLNGFHSGRTPVLLPGPSLKFTEMPRTLHDNSED